MYNDSRLRIILCNKAVTSSPLKRGRSVAYPALGSRYIQISKFTLIARSEPARLRTVGMPAAQPPSELQVLVLPGVASLLPMQWLLCPLVTFTELANISERGLNLCLLTLDLLNLSERNESGGIDLD